MANNRMNGWEFLEENMPWVIVLVAVVLYGLAGVIKALH